jgi:hypothetical protein
MFTSVRATVLPTFSVDVYPTAESRPTAREAYILSLSDPTVGNLELIFSSAQELQDFLTMTREAFAAAKQEAKARRAKLRRVAVSTDQATLF